ncbi:MAG: hypothetical protein K6T17_00250 [Fimbriimonadales bacterium]|nr:hypothetical protein [Fimbriimonadales bacterium]
MMSTLLACLTLWHPVIYANTVNAPFATLSSGIQSATVLRFSSQASPALVRETVAEKLAQEFANWNALAEEYHRARVEKNLLPPDLPFLVSRVVFVERPQGPSPAYQPGDLTLEFPTTGNNPGPFPQEYRQLLEDTFSSARPVMNALFGLPFRGGVVRVYNRDADIPDRVAVIGGAYVTDDGTGTPAIFFPVYNSFEAAAVNFIHTLFLAYLGPAIFHYDAWAEGFARAATMETVRLNGLPPGLDPDFVQLVLRNSYDNSAHYSWHNQRPLANNRFIAPNLLNLPLPPGGSLGGLYLMRYRQAGTAWAKVLGEYPAFFSQFLSRYYPAFQSDPAIAGNIPALKLMAQNTLNALAGTPDATVEGRVFEAWYRRQYILDTSVSLGRKVFVEAIPLPPFFSDDFGPFAFWTSYFETTDFNGNEQLLAGTSYPLFWDADFLRMFPSPQTDRMEISAGFGEVSPNLFDVFGSGSQIEYYKATVEIPIKDVLGRTVVPAGAIQRGSDFPPTTRNNFYGTVMGFDGDDANGDPTVKGIVRVQFLDPPATPPVDIPLRNGAFGANIPDPALNSPRRLKIEVIPVINEVEQPPIHTEWVNTWGNEVGLDIRLQYENSFTFNLPAGIQLLGFMVSPYESDAARVLGLPPSQTLVAQWRQERLDYARYPTIPPFTFGKSYYIRLPVAKPMLTVLGEVPGPQPVSVALQPGWNQIANPFPEPMDVGSLTVQRAAELELSYQEAINAGWIDSVLFTFQPGAPDPFSGIPEGGTMVPTISFEPGKGQFVRVLVPEGVTFTFRPAGSPSGRSSPASNPLDRALWVGSFTVTGWNGETSIVEVGQAYGATGGYDRGLDAQLPPLWGHALQAQIGTRPPMYRDIRPPGAQSWQILLSGLRRAGTYEIRISLRRQAGYSPVLMLRDQATGRSRVFRDGITYRFTANGGERRFTLSATRSRGGR